MDTLGAFGRCYIPIRVDWDAGEYRREQRCCAPCADDNQSHINRNAHFAQREDAVVLQENRNLGDREADVVGDDAEVQPLSSSSVHIHHATFTTNLQDLCYFVWIGSKYPMLPVAGPDFCKTSAADQPI